MPFEDLPREYRAHGSLHEMRLPRIVHDGRRRRAAERLQANEDLAADLWPVQGAS